jgi:1-acyl-sn-glycerol-3-phosphate acyltransferase
MFAFAVLLAVSLLPAYLAAVVGPALANMQAPEKQAAFSLWVSRIVIVLTSLGCRSAIGLAFWLRMHVEGMDTVRTQMGSSGRPCIVLANHTSIMDLMLLFTFLPLARVGKVKLLLANDIFDMPCIGRIAVAMGHLPLSVETSEESEENRQCRLLEECLVQGGTYGAWFAEGKRNTDNPRKVGPFEACNLELAVRLDVEVWCFTFVGNEKCWPDDASVGGFPAHLGLCMSRFCDSTRQFLEDAENLAEDADDRTKATRLANNARKEMQSKLDSLLRSMKAPLGGGHIDDDDEGKRR